MVILIRNFFVLQTLRPRDFGGTPNKLHMDGYTRGIMGCLDSTKTQIRIFWKRRAFMPVLSFKKLYFETTLLFKLASLEITIMISLMWSTCDTGITLVDIGTVFIRLSSNIKWDFSIAKIIAESVCLIQMSSKQNRKVYDHDGERLSFYQKILSKHRLRKEERFCNLCNVLQ